MSFVSDPTQDDQTDPNKQQGTATTQLSGGGSALFGSAPTAAAAGNGGSAVGGQGAQASNKSGSWTNLSAYLDANKDQAAQMGSDIAGSLDKEASGASSGLQGAQGEFNQDLGATGASLSQDKDFIDQSIAKPTATSDSDVSRFRNDFSGSYQGPKDLSGTSNWGDVTKSIGGATQDLGMTGNESGRDELLSRQYARPDYNQGEKNLDQMLVQRSGDAQNALSGVTSKWSGLNDQLNSGLTASQQAAKQRADDTAAANQYAQQSYNTANTNLTSGIDKRVSDLNAQRQADNAAALSQLQSGQFTADEAAKLGLTNGEYEGTVDPTHYLTQAAQVNKDQAANADEYATYAALSKLAGMDPTYLTPANATEAGQIGNGTTFDSAAYQKAATDNQTAAYGAINSQAQQMLTLLNNQAKLQGAGPIAYNGISDLPGLLAAIQANNTRQGGMVGYAQNIQPYVDSLNSTMQQYGFGSDGTGKTLKVGS